jgi:outer membrane lipoprotein-sorting protein
MRILTVCCLFLLGLRPAALLAQQSPADILEHTRSAYAALASYSDTAATIHEYGPSSQEASSFTTFFNRAPRHFLFDYRKPSDRIVVWGDPDAFHVWWKATGQVTEYPNPKNTGAIMLNDYPTTGTITKIPPLLYFKANMPGSIADFDPKRLAGMEDVGGSKCYRLEGSTSDTYGQTGKKVNVRSLTLWIDSSTYLVRRIVEESPTRAGMLNRTTTTITPQANPQISDDHFQYTPPK